MDALSREALVKRNTIVQTDERQEKAKKTE